MKWMAPIGWVWCMALACGDEAETPSDTREPSDARDTHEPDQSVSEPEPEVVDATADTDGELPEEVSADVADADTVEVDTAPPRTHGLETRVENTTCRLDGAPPLEIVPLALVPLTPELGAADVVAVANPPGVGALALVERAGRVRVFHPSGGSDTTTALDVSDRIDATYGLVSAAYDPAGGRLAVAYVAKDPSRLVVASAPTDGAGITTAQPTALATIPVDDPARAGGALTFRLDGTLLVAVGDGGAADPASDERLGAALVIDTAGDEPRTDLLASGFAVPTGCSIDRIAGRAYCVDADPLGQDRVLVVVPNAIVPLVTHPHSSAAGAAVAGFVSRDAAVPDDQGAYLYGSQGGLAGVRFDGALVRAEGTVVPDVNVAAFGEDDDGAIVVVDQAGHLHAVTRPIGRPAPAFPATVSATGCLADLAQRLPAPGLVPFEVRAPLWSDGAMKRRYLALPGTSTIAFRATGAWGFPDGTIFMKEFALDDDGQSETRPRIMETRFLVARSATRWEGYSYMWAPDGSDAFLLEGAEEGRYLMREGASDASGASVHRHTFPDRAMCLLCHNKSVGRALGLHTGHLNTDHDYDGFVENQLAAMDHVALFSEPLPAVPDELPRFARPDDAAAPAEARARAWLFSNCAHCHAPGGPTPVDLDLRYETPLAAMNACGRKPKYVIAQIPDAAIVTPGDPDHSELFFRLSRRDKNQMPPIATLINDPTGVEAVRAWIAGLGGCPTSPTP